VFIVLKRSNPFQVETGGKGFCHENGARFQFREMSSFVAAVVERFYTNAVVRCTQQILNYSILQ
jgi:hypothetical protein